MSTPTARPAHKLGANRNDPARQARRPRHASESCDLHEDRGTLQSKFGHAEATVARVTITQHPLPGDHRTLAAGRFPALLTEHGTPRTHPVHVRLARDGARSVGVAGSFNDWHPERNPLRRNAEGLWETELMLAPGDYEYRFVVDGEWTDDPLACRHVANPYGGVNALLRVHAH